MLGKVQWASLSLALQVREEELRYAIPQRALSLGIIHFMAASRESHHFNVPSGFDELVDDCQGIRIMYVIVAGAVGNQ